MRQVTACVLTALLCLLAATALHAQQTPASAVTAVPRLVRVTGTFVAADGLPAAPVETVTLAVYAEEAGGPPLWQETQDVLVGADGRYTLLLGATLSDGLPLDLFASGEARWLGRRFERAGEGEQARVALVSVPYAIKASDADTLGGLPASAYLLAESGASAGGGVTSPSATGLATTGSGALVSSLSAGAPGFVGKFVSPTDLGNSAIYDNGVMVGVNTTTPQDFFHVRFTDTGGTFTGLAVQNLGTTATSYSGMLFYDQTGALGQFQGFNNSTHEYRINNIATNGSINFLIGSSSKFRVRPDGDVDIPGAIRKGGTLFLHNFGTDNTAIGSASLSANTTGSGNVAVGVWSLYANTTGFNNAAVGVFSLRDNTTGYQNAAVGHESLGANTTGYANAAVGAYNLRANTTGSGNAAVGAGSLLTNTTGYQNAAVGAGSLYANTTGYNNAAFGQQSLNDNTTGGNNIAIGYRAGYNLTTGNDNIHIGHEGVAGEGSTIRIGTTGTHTRTFIAGINGVTTGAAGVAVLVDSNGQLGTISSSRRVKDDIADMGTASSRLMQLRPVTFHYTSDQNPSGRTLQYGLIAEEVAEVYPGLVARSADGQIETVLYQFLPPMLLNEYQQQQRTIEALREQVKAGDEQIRTLTSRVGELDALVRETVAALARLEKRQ